MSAFDEYIPGGADAAGEQVACPACEEPLAVEPVTVLRPGDEALAALFDGTLNVESCPACGATFVLDAPLLFRDDRRRYMVYLMPEREGRDWRTAEAAMGEISRRVFGEEPGVEPPECRLVLSRSQLIEKIALHLRGFDDRVVEYVKFQLLNGPGSGPRLNVRQHRLLYDFSPRDGDELAFIVFERDSDRAVAATHVPMDDYREVSETLLGNPELRRELQTLFPGCFVSVERLGGRGVA